MSTTKYVDFLNPHSGRIAHLIPGKGRYELAIKEGWKRLSKQQITQVRRDIIAGVDTKSLTYKPIFRQFKVTHRGETKYFVTESEAQKYSATLPKYSVTHAGATTYYKTKKAAERYAATLPKWFIEQPDGTRSYYKSERAARLSGVKGRLDQLSEVTGELQAALTVPARTQEEPTRTTQWVVRWTDRHGATLLRTFDTEEEGKRYITEKKVTETLGISQKTFDSYSEERQNVLINQMMAPMKFSITYTNNSGKRITETFNSSKDAKARALEVSIAQSESALKTAQADVLRQKQSLFSGMIGIANSIRIWGKESVDPKEKEQREEDIQRATKTFVSGAVDAAPVVIFTNALAGGAFMAGNVVAPGIGGAVAMGAVYLLAGIPALKQIADTFGTSQSRKKFNEWAKNNPQEAYDLVLKTSGAVTLGYLTTLGTTDSIRTIQRYNLDKFYKDLPLDDWESWYVKEEVMGFYPEETTGIQPISDQIMLRHKELSMGSTNWVQKWVDKAKIKTRVHSGELILAEGTGNGLDFPSMDYAAVVADQTLMPISPQTGKIIFKPVDIKLFLSFIDHNPAFRVQLEALAAKGVYVPGWMGIAGAQVLTDVEYQKLISKQIQIAISHDGQLTYYTIDQIGKELLEFATLPDLTPSQLTQVELFLQDPVVQKLMSETAIIQRLDLDVKQEQDIDDVTITLTEVDVVTEPPPPPPPPTITRPPIKTRRTGRPRGPEKPRPPRKPRPETIPMDLDRKIKIPRYKLPQVFDFQFQYYASGERVKVRAHTWSEALKLAQSRRKIKGRILEVEVTKI